jgi:hypothetical protein
MKSNEREEKKMDATPSLWCRSFTNGSRKQTRIRACQATLTVSEMMMTKNDKGKVHRKLILVQVFAVNSLTVGTRLNVNSMPIANKSTIARQISAIANTANRDRTAQIDVSSIVVVAFKLRSIKEVVCLMRFLVLSFLLRSFNDSRSLVPTTPFNGEGEGR